MRVAIFGGAGFIGTHIANYLVAKDPEVAIVLADVARPVQPIPPNARFVDCDVRNSIDSIEGPFDLVINLAAVHRTPGHEPWEYHETNEAGARNVTDFAVRTGAKRIWFTSSIAVYGPSESALTERSTPAPVSAYGKSKLAAEAIHEEWVRGEEGRTLVVARPATVFGPGEGGNFTRLASAMRKRTFFYPGRRDTVKACGYVKDLPRAFEFIEKHADPAALFNFAYPDPPTIEDVCEAIAAPSGYALPKFTIPSRVLLTAGALLSRVGVTNFDPDRVRKLMLSTNIVGETLAERGFEFEYPLEAALADWFKAPPAGRFE